ncbi:MAG: hypothetical protein IPP51_01415 [Bacteroidetes bacterium]|nr:hypothetical protein [Bacteroidota bacterium]
MKRILALILFVFVVNTAMAQKYTFGIGGRAGKFYTGASMKFVFATDNATSLQLDVMYANVASGGYVLKGYLIKQIPFKIPIVQLPLDFVYGLGVHAGYYPFEPQGYYKRSKKDANYYDKSVVTIGADLTAQIEYKIPRVPITLGIECVPFYEFVNPGPEFVDFGVSIRYVFR